MTFYVVIKIYESMIILFLSGRNGLASVLWDIVAAWLYYTDVWSWCNSMSGHEVSLLLQECLRRAVTGPQGDTVTLPLPYGNDPQHSGLCLQVYLFYIYN